MPANFNPIYSRSPDIQYSSAYITDVSSGTSLTQGTSYLIFTSDATNGGYVQKLRLRAAPQVTTTATVLRLWVNVGTGSTTNSSNSSIIDEISLPATTGTSNAATANYEIPLNFPLPAGYKLYATLGSCTNNGWMATCFGGKY